MATHSQGPVELVDLVSTPFCWLMKVNCVRLSPFRKTNQLFTRRPCGEKSLLTQYRGHGLSVIPVIPVGHTLKCSLLIPYFLYFFSLFPRNKMFFYVPCPKISYLYSCSPQKWGPRGFGDLGRMAIYFQGAGEHL